MASPFTTAQGWWRVITGDKKTTLEAGQQQSVKKAVEAPPEADLIDKKNTLKSRLEDLTKTNKIFIASEFSESSLNSNLPVVEVIQRLNLSSDYERFNRLYDMEIALTREAIFDLIPIKENEKGEQYRALPTTMDGLDNISHLVDEYRMLLSEKRTLDRMQVNVVLTGILESQKIMAN